MVVGDYYSYKINNRFKRKFYSFMGSDLHSHIRIGPLIKYFEGLKDLNIKILEIGCGNGINAFELYKLSDNIEYWGFDLDCESIKTAQNLSKFLGYDKHAHFYCEDAIKASFKFNEKFDFILLIDFLEHLKNPEEILSKISPLLNKDSIFIVSVPTPNYKKIFGEDFHYKMGHVKNGYYLKEIENLFETINYKIVDFSYNTGLFSEIGCFFYYRVTVKNAYIDLMKVILLTPFRYIDIINSEKISCTLFAVLIKK